MGRHDVIGGVFERVDFFADEPGVSIFTQVFVPAGGGTIPCRAALHGAVMDGHDGLVALLAMIGHLY